jgi:hypothetical protein
VKAAKVLTDLNRFKMFKLFDFSGDKHQTWGYIYPNKQLTSGGR